MSKTIILSRSENFVDKYFDFSYFQDTIILEGWLFLFAFAVRKSGLIHSFVIGHQPTALGGSLFQSYGLWLFISLCQRLIWSVTLLEPYFIASTPANYYEGLEVH